MTNVRDICRICMQETRYDDTQVIDVDKLYEKWHLLPKWEKHLFQGHLICNICIDNFRTMRNLHKLAVRSNRETQQSKISTLRLEDLKRYQHIKESFFACRLCLEPTKKPAVCLYASPSNTLPKEYVIMMLKYVKLHLDQLSVTVKPIICYNCWQRIQVTFTFRKHLDLVTERVQHFQTLLNKSYVNREDLQDIVYMWDKLGEYSDSSIPNSPDIMPQLQLAHTYFNKHNYLRNDSCAGSSDISFVDIEDCSDMPGLESQAAEKELKKPEKFEMPSRKRKCKTQPRKKKKKVKTKAKKPELSWKNLLSNYKVPKVQESSSNLFTHITSPEKLHKHRTRLSARKEAEEEQEYRNLLVVRKEKIIKKSRKKIAKHSTSNMYSFETLNLANEINELQIERESIEEEEIQVKREVLSDTDDDFHDNGFMHDNDIGDEPCPNLDVFIKTEPLEVVDVDEDEEPPEMEFQGPCNYDPKFTISETFTVNEKRELLINTVAEKRSLVNESLEDGSRQKSPNVEQRFNGTRNLLVNTTVDDKRDLINLVRNNSLEETRVTPALKKSPIRDVVMNLIQCDSKKPCSKIKQRRRLVALGTCKKKKSTVASQADCSVSYLQNDNSVLERSMPNILGTGDSSQVEESKEGKSEFRASLPVGEKETDLTSSLPPVKFVFCIYDDKLPTDGKSPFICQECDFTTFYMKAAKCHITLHKTHPDRWHKCTLCSYTCLSARKLSRHRTTKHSPEPEMNAKCLFCKLPRPDIGCIYCGLYCHPVCMIKSEPDQFPSDCPHPEFPRLSVSTTNIISLAKTWKSKIPRKCGACQEEAIPSWIYCEKRKDYFHYACYSVHESKVHPKDTESQVPGMPEPMPSTSNIKQEQEQDLSNFIMLCD